MTDRDDTSRTDPGSRSAAEIEREVEGTRARLTGTIEELRDRVSPGQIFEQGVDWLRGSGGNEFLGNLGRALRDNPMPVALIGAGIAWLALSGDKGEGRGDRRDADRRVPLTYGADMPDRMQAAPMPRGASRPRFGPCRLTMRHIATRRTDRGQPAPQRAALAGRDASVRPTSGIRPGRRRTAGRSARGSLVRLGRAPADRLSGGAGARSAPALDARRGRRPWRGANETRPVATRPGDRTPPAAPPSSARMRDTASAGCWRNSRCCSARWGLRSARRSGRCCRAATPRTGCWARRATTSPVAPPRWPTKPIPGPATASARRWSMPATGWTRPGCRPARARRRWARWPATCARWSPAPRATWLAVRRARPTARLRRQRRPGSPRSRAPGAGPASGSRPGAVAPSQASGPGAWRQARPVRRGAAGPGGRSSSSRVMVTA